MNEFVIALIAIGVVGLIVFFWGIGIYNRLVRLRQHLNDSWSGVDVELKRRYDLIPNLVETVKGYAAHESETLEKVIQARNTAVGNIGSPSSQAKDESALMGAMRQLSVVIERYPDLKADTHFASLQGELAETEDRLASARRMYNGNTRDMNTMVESFPSMIIAGMFRFEKAEYFEIDDPKIRQAPKVSF